MRASVSNGPVLCDGSWGPAPKPPGIFRFGPIAWQEDPEDRFSSGAGGGFRIWPWRPPRSALSTHRSVPCRPERTFPSRCPDHAIGGSRQMPGFGAERRRGTIRKRRLTYPVLLASMANWVYNGVEALIEATLEADERAACMRSVSTRGP
jgi:hypothetical protein